ncbi:MAG TPA: FtsW/RodA/SpoVE family cell cycle protein, partial [Microlunatus sp.]|nr:FtsW/RodA/SpoVE family cell cycle protein [Microlunatus sp.]
MSESAMVVVPRKRRGAELFLLVFALVLVLGAYAQVDLNVDGQLSARFPALAIGSTVAVLLAHAAVRWRIPYADPVLLPCVVLLNGLGIAMIHRIDLINDPPLDGARTQLIWTALGLILFIV